MAKTKTKKTAVKKAPKSRRVIKCSKCEGEGHNARTCKAGEASKVEAAPKATKTEVPPPPVKKVVRKVDARHEESASRPRPTRGNESAGTPYPCPRCAQIGVLVSVKVKDHNKSYKAGKDVFTTETRCEKCFQKPPTDLIVKWGATPGEKIELPDEGK